MESVPDDLLGVGTEEVGGRGHLGRVDLDRRILSDLSQQNFLLDCEELVEIERILVRKLLPY